MDNAKSPTSDTTNNAIQSGRDSDPANDVGHYEDILAAGATSIAELEKLIEDLQAARDFLQSEGERVRHMNTRYAHLTRTASASVGILAGRLDGWRNAEMKAAAQSDVAMRQPYAPPFSSAHDGEPQQG